MNQPEQRSPLAQERQIFLEAMRIPDANSRSGYLDAACRENPELRANIDLLLASSLDDAFLETPPTGVLGLIENMASQTPPIRSVGEVEEMPVAQIGLYTIEKKLGEGGCGMVYLARQEQPIRRHVALKVIKLGMDTRSVIARFEAECQALAMMDHPNIARIYDAGVLGNAESKGEKAAVDGERFESECVSSASPFASRPYFVMELVHGVKITDYCEQHSLSTRERLYLFGQVCSAMQHAHQKGVIHRDIKPSNVLVTEIDGKPVPKVIDFGIAKATERKLTDKTLFTQFAQFLGTPAYMSPEQAALTNVDIDTRSDIYSLGVLLYELLTGTTPFDTRELMDVGFDEMRRIIRETEPDNPSARLNQSLLAPDVRLKWNLKSGVRNSELEKASSSRVVQVKDLIHQLRGDLDWIVMKCLEKDRSRRYETANGLAADIQRHLSNEPVTAGAPSRAYKFQKYIRRNKGPLSAVAAVLFALLGGLGLTAWQALRASRALDELRASAPAFAEQARVLASEERFDEAIEKLAYASKLRPDVPEYFIRRGDLYKCQLRLADAREAYRESLRLRSDDRGAIANVELCDELLAAPLGLNGRLSHESLGRLYGTMQQQQRPAAELMPVARLLGEGKKHLLDYWAARLKDLPISDTTPLMERFSVREDGLLSLELCSTRIVDLRPLAGMPLGSLELRSCEELYDLKPLRSCPSLKRLNISSTKVTDLSPLSELKLEDIDLSGTKVFDLSPLRGMPLKKLSLGGTAVTDLAPIKGMPLTELYLNDTPVLDISPLFGLPLEKCSLRRCRLCDLSPLRGMPLKELSLWGCVQVRDYSALSSLKNLEYLFLPDEIRALSASERAAIGRLRSLPRLQRIGTDVLGGRGYTTLGSAEDFWQEWERDSSFLDALYQGDHISFLARLPNGTFRLVCKKDVGDLSFLRDSPVTELAVNGSSVSDLSPIRNLKLSFLNIYDSPVSDLNPLRGMPIEHLYIGATRVSDLSPLEGMPLRTFYASGCSLLKNVSFLSKFPTLEQVSLPMGAQEVEALRDLPRLERIGFGEVGTGPGLIAPPICSAELFWKTWDGMKWARFLEQSGIKHTKRQRTDGFFSVSVSSSRFTNCSIFKGSNIRELDLSHSGVIDFRPLLDSTNITKLILPISVRDEDVLRRLSTRVQLSFNEVNGNHNSPDEFWRIWDSLVWSRSLTEAGAIHTGLRQKDGSWSVTIDQIPNGGLTILSNAPITVLWLGGTTITNLTPLRGMRLRQLYLFNTRVTELSALLGMPLEVLNLVNTQVKDISPLRELPLSSLRLHDCPMLSDISPLKSVGTLKDLTLPRNSKEIAFLRTFSKLKRLSFRDDPHKDYRPAQTAEEFWAEYDRNRN